MEENLISLREDHSFHVRYRMEASCLELALEGERLCKSGDCHAAVSFFEAAVQVGTEDLKTLSLGNAYFYLHNYAKALEYHHHDLTLARTIGDQLGEAKASGNLGNTLKVLGNFDEAIVCYISRELNDKVGEARTLYNLGNVYHAKGKSFGCPSPQDVGEFPEEVRNALQAAVDLYEENLSLVAAFGDRAAQGRAFGNLGNTHYFLGNFRDAVIAQEQRLLIAKEFGDKAAERRAYSNLGNTLLLARQCKHRAAEAQSYYSLGNTYALLQDYEKAIDYHLKHLGMAEELKDRTGEGRACWSLGNASIALGNHDQALHFSEKHLEISKEVGDKSGELTAQLNLSDLQMVLGMSYRTNNSMMSENIEIDSSINGAHPKLGRRLSMKNMELMKLTPEKPLFAKPSAKLLFVNRLNGKKYKSSTSTKVLQDASNSIDHRIPNSQRKISAETIGDEAFFDLLRFQSNRLDDQRCCLQENACPTAKAASSTPGKASRKSPPASVVSPTTDEFLDLLTSSQSQRLDDQRASFSHLPGLRLTKNNHQSVLGHLITKDKKEPDEDFFDILVKCQGSRLDDQRCAPPPAATKSPTVPDQDFFSLILRSQAKRMDEQRVLLHRDQNRDSAYELKDLLQSHALLELNSGK
uniref:G-protein-signaling modulator 2 n=1 Tax=Jaculus jaculus TaxID=51337 RepID=A0A8C5KI91_JACJA